jgi:hypothetical protein
MYGPDKSGGSTKDKIDQIIALAKQLPGELTAGEDD